MGIKFEQEVYIREFPSFQNGAVFAKDIFAGDDFRDAGRHADMATAKNEDFIGIENSVPVVVEDDEFIAVFFFDFFSEFADSGIFPIHFQFGLFVHPILKGGGQCHGQDREVGMGTESGQRVSRRSLDESCLLGLPEQGVFDFAAFVIAVIHPKGFMDGTIGLDHHFDQYHVIFLNRGKVHCQWQDASSRTWTFFGKNRLDARMVMVRLKTRSNAGARIDATREVIKSGHTSPRTGVGGVSSGMLSSDGAGVFFLAPRTRSIPHLPAIEADQSHERLRMEDDRINMPIEFNPTT